MAASSLVIVSAAFVFSRILTFHRVLQALLDLLLSISDNAMILVLLMTLVLLVVGTFMDALANMIIMGPLLLPVMVGGLGMPPMQVGFWLMIGLLLGLLTSPFGLALFMVSPVAKVPVLRVAVAVMPFLLAQIAVLLAVAWIPGLTLALPRLTGLIQ